MTDTLRLRYRGEPGLANALVQLLEREGLTVTWRPPAEQRSLGRAVETVIEMTVSGAAVASLTAASKAAARKVQGAVPSGRRRRAGLRLKIGLRRR